MSLFRVHVTHLVSKETSLFSSLVDKVAHFGITIVHDLLISMVDQVLGDN